MTLSEELTIRGFLYQTTSDDLAALLDGEKKIIYHGIDPSADSAHAGNFVIWLLLRHLVAAGHQVIFLVGGGTGMIGDPKPDAERELRAEDLVDKNVTKIKAQAEHLIGQGQSITFVNNKEWLGSVPLLSFLRDIGKHFTVNELIKKDAISKRLSGDSGISYTEFAYPLLQGYDYFVLHERFGCNVQVGGSDQWGNILSGVDLIRRKTGQTVHAITVPLIVDKVTGKKFGKSEGNAVWLDAEKTSPYNFYQFWLNVSDENVEDYLKLFSFIPLPEIDVLITEHNNDKGQRQAQKRLAFEITSLVHGADVAKLVSEVSNKLFSGQNLKQCSLAEREVVVKNSPTHTIAENINIIDLLVESGLAASKREARQFVSDGAVTLDGEIIVDDQFTVLCTADLRTLKRGKKNFVVLV